MIVLGPNQQSREEMRRMQCFMFHTTNSLSIELGKNSVLGELFCLPLAEIVLKRSQNT